MISLMGIPVQKRDCERPERPWLPSDDFDCKRAAVDAVEELDAHFALRPAGA